jgi:hypothetical protein
MHQQHIVLLACTGIVAVLASMVISCRPTQPKRSWPELAGKPVGDAQHAVYQETQGMQSGFMYQDNALLTVDTETVAVGNKVKGTFDGDGLLIDAPELVDAHV